MVVRRMTALTGRTATDVTIDTAANSVAVGINGVFVNGLITVTTPFFQPFGPTMFFHPTVNLGNIRAKIRNRKARHNRYPLWWGVFRPPVGQLFKLTTQSGKVK
jgi:hypothetical protein